jgi:hypothetical protein
MYGAWDAKVDEHPEDVVAELGIRWQKAVPQSIADQWWFFNCENVPDQMPPFITELGLKPSECIGLGLSEDDAKSLEEKP